MTLPAWMKLGEAISVQSTFFEKWDADGLWQLLKTFDLHADQIFGQLSKGQKRWFMIAMIVAQRPDLLILDEPSGGLDVSVRRQFLDLLLELANERQITVLIASHILSDVERVVDHVAFIKEGKTVCQPSLKISSPGSSDCACQAMRIATRSKSGSVSCRCGSRPERCWRLLRTSDPRPSRT